MSGIEMKREREIILPGMKKLVFYWQRRKKYNSKEQKE